MNTEVGVAGALAAIEELRVDSKTGKGKHFAASDRKMLWHRIFGVPVIVANLFVGIVLVNLQSTSGANEAPVSSRAAVASSSSTSISTGPESEKSNQPKSPLLANEYLSLLSILLAFGAASLSGVQTFFNFHKASEGHRAIGNRYTHVSRQCKVLQQRHRDIPFLAKDLWEEYAKVYSEYNQINTEAEAFPTGASDLKAAKKTVEISPYKNPHA